MRRGGPSAESDNASAGGAPVKQLNGQSALVSRPADECCLFCLAASPICTHSGMIEE
jgi:hypothetical protein